MVSLTGEMFDLINQHQVKTLMDDVRLHHLRKRDGFAITDEPSCFHIGQKYSYKFIFVEEGFLFDGLSVPWFLSWLIKPYGEYLNAGLLHDELYRNRTLTTALSDKAWSFETLTRKQCDKIFYEALLCMGCPKWKADVAHGLLKAFGGRAWKKHRKNDVGALSLTSK